MNKLLLFIAASLAFAGSLRAQDTLRQVQTFPAPRAIASAVEIPGLLGSPSGLSATDASRLWGWFFKGGDSLVFTSDSILYAGKRVGCPGLFLADSSYLIKGLDDSIIIYNITSRLASSPDSILFNNVFPYSIYDVKTGDINGDGLVDVIARISYGMSESVSFVYLLGGSADSIRKLFPPFIPIHYYGMPFDSRGDVNGDGATDIVCFHPNGATPQVDIWFGRRDMVFPDHADLVIPNNGTGFFGSWITSNCDFNGDGYDDVWVGGGGGNIYLGGNPMDTVVDIVITGFSAFGNWFFGGNFDNDSFGDYLVGPDYGYRLYYGGEHPPSSTATYGPVGDVWGTAITTGDFNGDGADDAIVYGGYGWIRYLRHPHPHSGVSLWQDLRNTSGNQQILLLWPNPVTNGKMRYRFTLPWKGHLKVEMFFLDGRRLKTLVDRDVYPGILEDAWDGSNITGLKLSTQHCFMRIRYNKLHNTLGLQDAKDDPIDFTVPVTWIR